MAKDLHLLQGSMKMRMEDLPPEAWRMISGNQETGDAQNLYSTVAILFRCINARADAAASVPFRLENRRGRAVETSDDWRGGMGFLPYPKTLIRQMFMSMDFTNSAYSKILKNQYKIVKGLQYFVPTTITPKFDDNGNLLYFKRTVSGKTLDPIQPEEMFYYWKQDAFVEVGASPNTPVKAALQAAGILNSLGAFVQSYFEGGAIDPVIAAIPRSTDKDERERLSGLLNRSLTGIKNLGKIFLASTDDVKLTQPLRNGLESLKKTELTQEQRENVALAMGVPLSFLLGNQANYATATQEEKTMIRWGVQPNLELLFEAMSTQLYSEMGYKLRPDFDNLEAFQEEEVQRSSALSAFIDAVQKPKTKEQLVESLNIMGYDVNEEQIEKLWVEKEDVPEPLKPDTQQPAATPQDVSADDMTTDSQQANTRAIVELGRWEKKSINADKLVTWHTVIIPEDVRRHVIDSQDWREAFSEARQMLGGTKETAADIKYLADAINRLAETGE